MIIPARIACDDCGRSVPLPRRESWEERKSETVRLPVGWTQEWIASDKFFQQPDDAVLPHRCPRCTREVRSADPTRGESST